MNADDLPEGWEAATLADGLAVDVQPGFACGAHNRDGEGVAHLRPMNVSDQGCIDLGNLKFVPKTEADRDERWVRQGDVVFNNTNSPELVGKTACYLLPEPRAFSNHMTRVRCRQDAFDPQFCAMLLHHKWQEGYFEAICNNHVSQASISRTVLLEMPLLLPPLAEQQRIVAKVEALLAFVNASRQRLAKLPALLKRFRQAVLAAACSGRLTADSRDEQPDLESAAALVASLGKPGPVIRDDLDLFELPERWMWADLRTLIDRGEQFCYGVVQPGEDNPEGVPLIRAGDLRRGTVLVSDLRRIPASVDEQYPRSRVIGGELLITVVGAGIGTVSIVPQNCAGFNIARAIAKAPIRAFSVNYIYYWLTTTTALGVCPSNEVLGKVVIAFTISRWPEPLNGHLLI